ncbi:MAG: hypothetical protein XD50_1724 [Clostridia bacterium 41_269]|nr:MAG: hypothetical protein XD50_1724 [Clostridia bacterium 41_269]
MKAALVDMGVPGDKIIEEGSSRTTLENAVRTLGILEKQGYKRIILVTDAVHMKRALMVFEGKGMEVVPHPSGYLYEDSPGILDWLPNRDSLEANLRAAHERAGLWYYKLLASCNLSRN